MVDILDNIPPHGRLEFKINSFPYHWSNDGVSNFGPVKVLIWVKSAVNAVVSEIAAHHCPLIIVAVAGILVGHCVACTNTLRNNKWAKDFD
jgi:hypothetical protein